MQAPFYLLVETSGSNGDHDYAKLQVWPWSVMSLHVKGAQIGSRQFYPGRANQKATVQGGCAATFVVIIRSCDGFNGC